MAQANELARKLVEYDERLALELLERICGELGGPPSDGDRDVGEMRDFLSDPEAAQSRPLTRLGDVADSPATTSEWKSEFSRSERMRALGLALADRLAPKLPK